MHKSYVLYNTSVKPHIVLGNNICFLQDCESHCMPRSSRIWQWSISKVVLEKNVIHSFIWDDIFNAPWRYLRTKLECAKIFKACDHLKRTCFTFVFLRSYFYDSWTLCTEISEHIYDIPVALTITPAITGGLPVDTKLGWLTGWLRMMRCS